MENLVDALSRLSKTLPRGSNFSYEVVDGLLRLETIYIPSGKRGRGTEFLAKVLAETDRYGVEATLYADPTDEPEDPGTFDLVVWYSRFGFKLDHINEDEWVGMRRPPQPFRGGHEPILDDYRKAKEKDICFDEFEAWRDTANASSPKPRR